MPKPSPQAEWIAEGLERFAANLLARLSRGATGNPGGSNMPQVQVSRLKQFPRIRGDKQQEYEHAKLAIPNAVNGLVSHAGRLSEVTAKFTTQVEAFRTSSRVERREAMTAETVWDCDSLLQIRSTIRNTVAQFQVQSSTMVLAAERLICAVEIATDCEMDCDETPMTGLLTLSESGARNTQQVMREVEQNAERAKDIRAEDICKLRNQIQRKWEQEVCDMSQATASIAGKTVQGVIIENSDTLWNSYSTAEATKTTGLNKPQMEELLKKAAEDLSEATATKVKEMVKKSLNGALVLQGLDESQTILVKEGASAAVARHTFTGSVLQRMYRNSHSLAKLCAVIAAEVLLNAENASTGADPQRMADVFPSEWRDKMVGEAITKVGDAVLSTVERRAEIFSEHAAEAENGV